MKTIQQVQEENLMLEVYTIEEFLELLDDGDVSPYDYDHFGYYHDGEELTEKLVWLNKNDIIENGKKYPYIAWRFY